MGLFSKLFAKKENEVEKKPDDNRFESPYGTFFYSDDDVNSEYGYECEISWNEGDVPSCVFIETDTLDNKEYRLCYERFERIYADKDSFDYDCKSQIADFMLSHPELFPSAAERGKDKLIEYMDLGWLGIRRNGDIECTMDGCLHASHIHLLVRENGSKEIEYDDDNEMNHKKFSI